MILPAGTTITCENNHRICETTVDIKSGDPGPLICQFRNWEPNQSMPKSNTRVQHCARCNGAFIIRKRSGGMMIHTVTGWVFEDSDK